MTYVRGVHHVQIAAPAGSEDEARDFFGHLLGLREIAKPAHLASRGGVWFRCGAIELHVGADPDVRPVRTALVALEVEEIEYVRARLAAARVPMRDEEPVPGYRRFSTDDPFGNRLELLQPAPARAAAVATRIRPADLADVPSCAEIARDAFAAVQERHGMGGASSLAHWFRVVERLVEHPGVYGVVAERDEAIVGASFLYEHDPIRSVGTLVVAPDAQGSGVGRRLTEAMLERARGAPGVRLVQAAYNATSFALYAALGFEVKEPLVTLSGRFRSSPPADATVRKMREDDLAVAVALCERVHGFGRAGDLRDALETLGSAAVLERDGRIVAYASGQWLGDTAHGVAESEADMRALLLNLPPRRDADVSFIMPTRQASLLRWCLAEGMRVGTQLTLMATGEYRDPRGVYFPSIWY